MFEPIEVVTTAGGQAEARAIARALLEARLAACVQVDGPIESLYWWEGRLETNREWRVVAKTSRRCYERVEAAIRGVHSYEVPQIIAVSVVAGSAAYVDWLKSELQRDGGRGDAGHDHDG